MDPTQIASYVAVGLTSPVILEVVKSFAARGSRSMARKQEDLTQLAKERSRADREREYRIRLRLWGSDLELILRTNGLDYPPAPHEPADLRDVPHLKEP